jgi:putative methyltransferase (TIGR04325 family)
MGDQLVNRRSIATLIGRLRRRRPEPAPVWSGVYRSFSEIPQTASSYSSSAAIRAAEGLLRETQQQPMPREAAIDHEVLALAVRLMSSSRVSVIDLGGGVGQSYAALRSMLSPALGLQYRVADLGEVVRRGRELWAGNDEIDFSSNLSIGDFAPSIIFSKGFIQYIPDYKALLREWCSAGARWILLEKLSVVNCPTYATVQVDVYGAGLPYWMFNIADLETVAQEAGYRIALQRRLERVYDQSDFPAELRMRRATSLLFERA